MILIVNSSEKERYAQLVNAMFRQRADVFHERLKWDVKVVDGMEIDEFDDLNLVYLLSVDDVTGRLRGSLRLLPTTGRNMLRDVFGSLLPENEYVESATIWESSRFSRDSENDTPEPGCLISRVTGELLAGAYEIGLMAGLTDIVSVFDARMIRVLRAAGCPPTLIGTPQRIGICMTYAGLFEINEQILRQIRKASGITGSVLEPQSAKRLFAA